ncbi:hypothetical protein [Asticcacaulis tiandongensis]|uniref:hypothetical protein n=1 Tax=Asticcacaulis tiandongensis TaxID=2565365 RepID=UPI001C64290D|nr:hypothetical protein [Asticcacaulis tiandongensis]
MTANDKTPDYSWGCLPIIGIILFFLLKSCFADKPSAPVKERPQYSNDGMTYKQRNAAAAVVRSSGYWCENPVSLHEQLTGSTIQEYIVMCDTGDRVARYKIRMTPEGNFGTVRPL